MDARKANDRIADKAERLKFVSRIPMLCECSEPRCHSMLMVSLDEYRQIRQHPDNFLTAHGHHLDGAEPDLTTADYVIQRVWCQREGNGHFA